MTSSKKHSNKLLVPYITLGDPDKSSTEALVHACLDAGADMVEIGIPFSDPVADGPVIQASHQKALSIDPSIGIDDGFDVVKAVKKTQTKPLIFMVAANIVYAYGIERFFKTARSANLDACLIPDICIEDASDYIKCANKYGIQMVFLVSTLTDPKRLKKIVKHSQPFIYLISSTGTTGEKKAFASNLAACVKDIKKITNVPVLVGFGVSTKEHVEFTSKIADGAIVGSALVNLISSCSTQQEAVEMVSTKIKNFKKNQVCN